MTFYVYGMNRVRRNMYECAWMRARDFNDRLGLEAKYNREMRITFIINTSPSHLRNVTFIFGNIQANSQHNGKCLSVLCVLTAPKHMKRKESLFQHLNCNKIFTRIFTNLWIRLGVELQQSAICRDVYFMFRYIWWLGLLLLLLSVALGSFFETHEIRAGWTFFFHLILIFLFSHAIEMRVTR